jgi:hypothetical protein
MERCQGNGCKNRLGWNETYAGSFLIWPQKYGEK